MPLPVFCPRCHLRKLLVYAHTDDVSGCSEHVHRCPGCEFSSRKPGCGKLHEVKRQEAAPHF